MGKQISINQYVERYEGLDIPVLLGFVENGKIVLEDLTGAELPFEILEFVQKNNLSFEKFVLLKKIEEYEESGYPVPKTLRQRLEELDGT